MAKCEICGNDYDRALEIIVEGESHVFDSFECAIQGLAPTCPHCGCRVIGHGGEQKGQIFCCVHCARAAGPTELRDHACAPGSTNTLRNRYDDRRSGTQSSGGWMDSSGTEITALR